MAADSTPYGGPNARRLDNGRNCPVRPRNRLTFNAVHIRNEFLERGLIGVPLRLAPCHVVELGYGMRGMARVIPVGIGCQNNRSAGELRYRDVIRVTVTSIRSKRSDDMRPDATNMGCNLSLGFDGIGSIEVAIDVVEKICAANSQLPGRGAQFRFTHLANDVQLGPHGSVSETAALAARRRYQVRVNPFLRIFG